MEYAGVVYIAGVVLATTRILGISSFRILHVLQSYYSRESAGREHSRAGVAGGGGWAQAHRHAQAHAARQDPEVKPGFACTRVGPYG